VEISIGERDRRPRIVPGDTGIRFVIHPAGDGGESSAVVGHTNGEQ